jgi:hypothetical protein
LHCSQSQSQIPRSPLRLAGCARVVLHYSQNQSQSPPFSAARGLLWACCVALQSEPEPPPFFFHSAWLVVRAVRARAKGPVLHCAWLAVRAGRLWACCVACCVVGALRFVVFCVWICCAVSQSGETPLHPPPLLRPASPMRFVIFLLGLQRRQLAPDLSNAQFTLSATKQTGLVSVRTLYNSRGLWGDVEVFFCSWGRCLQPPALPGAWPAAPSAPARTGGGAACRLTSRVAYWCIAVERDPPSPPPLLRPASPMRFVIF